MSKLQPESIMDFLTVPHSVEEVQAMIDEVSTIEIEKYPEFAQTCEDFCVRHIIRPAELRMILGLSVVNRIGMTDPRIHGIIKSLNLAPILGDVLEKVISSAVREMPKSMPPQSDLGDPIFISSDSVLEFGMFTADVIAKLPKEAQTDTTFSALSFLSFQILKHYLLIPKSSLDKPKEKPDDKSGSSNTQ